MHSYQIVATLKATYLTVFLIKHVWSWRLDTTDIWRNQSPKAKDHMAFEGTMIGCERESIVHFGALRGLGWCFIGGLDISSASMVEYNLRHRYFGVYSSDERLSKVVSSIAYCGEQLIA
jgi:hypothetical protein